MHRLFAHTRTESYPNLMHHVCEHGTDKVDHTGTSTHSVFGHQVRFNLQDGLLLVTTKKIHIKSIVYELLWFPQGTTNMRQLQDNDVTIWDEWADADDELGLVYGSQWRSWPAPNDEHIDQIAELTAQIKRNPDSRRLIVLTWNAASIPCMELPSCHALLQLYVTSGKLSYQLYQHSTDIFPGVPSNIASYAPLVYMVIQQVGLDMGDFAWTGSDCHLYNNRFEQVRTQLARKPLPLPKLHIKHKPESAFDYQYEDFEIVGYQSHSAIKAPVAV